MAQLERFQSAEKLLLHKEWLQYYIEHGANYPITIEIDPTNDCPLDCVMCKWKDFRSGVPASLDTDLMKNMVVQAANLGVKSLIWTGGGEPLSNQGTLDAIELARRLGLQNAMFTNAVAMTPRVSEALLGNLTWIRFHLDAASSVKYSELHDVSASVFETVVRNIGHFCKRRREMGSMVSAGIGAIASFDNFHEVGDLARLAKTLGLDYFQYKHDLTCMSDRDYHAWWDCIVAPKMDLIAQEQNDKKFTLQYSRGVNYFEGDPSSKCHVHFLATALVASGLVAFCKSLRDSNDLYLGDLRTAPLKDILDSDHHRELERRVTPKNCGVFPCPYRDANMLIDGMVQSGQVLTVSGRQIEHQDFI